MSAEPLQCSAGVVVEASDVAGGFYCEHAFFATKAAAPSALVGFVHVPPGAQPRATLSARHGATREVLAAALRDVVAKVHGSCRVLLTGYGPWGEVLHNPSGDFVSHPSNLRAILLGLGAKGVGRRDGVVGGVIDGVDVTIAGVVLAVDDSAIDGGPRSLQHAIAAHHPDVVIGLGVHRTSDTIRIECRATDVCLVPRAGAFARDVAKTEPSTILRDDRLYRCVLSGWRTLKSPSTTPLPSSSLASSSVA